MPAWVVLEAAVFNLVPTQLSETDSFGCEKGDLLVAVTLLFWGVTTT